MKVLILLLFLFVGCTSNLEDESRSECPDTPIDNANDESVLNQYTEDKAISNNTDNQTEIVTGNNVVYDDLEEITETTSEENNSTEEVSLSPGGERYIVMKTEVLNVRDQPSLDGNVLSTIDQEHWIMERVVLLIDEETDSEDNLWYKVEYDVNKYGWIASWYTEQVTEITDFKMKVEEFASIINEGSENKLLEFLNLHTFFEGDIDVLLELYSMLYQDSEIIDTRLYGSYSDMREYLITYESGVTMSVMLSHSTNAGIQFYENTIRHSDTIKWWLDAYIDVLKNKDWEGAVNMSNHMGYEEIYRKPEYSVSWLDLYIDNFDLETLNWRLIRHYDSGSYDCEIYGFKGTEPMAHMIYVYTANNVIAHDDDYVFNDFDFYNSDDN